MLIFCLLFSHSQNEAINLFVVESEIIKTENKAAESLKSLPRKAETRARKCSMCELTFPNVSKLEEHLKREHENHMEAPKKLNARFECIRCAAEFETKEDGQEHVRSRHPRLNMKNGLISKKSVDAAAENGAEAHQNVEDMTTDIKNLKKSNQIEKYLAGLKRVNNRYPCNRCEKTFREASTLRIHLRKHYNLRPYHCRICGGTYTTPQYLEVHIENHSAGKGYKCPICYKAFKTKYSAFHMRKHHPDSNVKEFLKVSDTQGTSAPAPQLKCIKLKPGVSDDDIIVELEAFVQSMEKSADGNLSCPECERAFKKRSSLADHLRSHANVRPYSCRICEAKFTTTDYMKQHMKRSHVRSESTYKCKVCKKSVKTRQSIKSHIQKKHNGVFKNWEDACDEIKADESSSDDDSDDPDNVPLGMTLSKRSSHFGCETEIRSELERAINEIESVQSDSDESTIRELPNKNDQKVRKLSIAFKAGTQFLTIHSDSEDESVVDLHFSPENPGK